MADAVTADASSSDSATDAAADATDSAVADALDATARDATPVDAASDSAAADVAASDAAADAAPDALVANRAPTVSVITAPTGAVTGASVALSITATDADGDPLTITWTQLAPAAAGTFSTPSAATTTWISPALGAATDADIQVSVTDGRSAAIVRTARVSITPARFSANVQPVFSMNCTGCHGGSGGLTLTAGVAYTNLVNVTASTPACGATVRVQPGSPSGSVLFRRTSSAGCGARMPRSDPDYFARNPGELVAIESWILSGAPNN